MKKILSKIEKIKQNAVEEIEKADSPEKLEKLRVKYLGRKSDLTGILRSIKDLNKNAKKEVGSLANKTRSEIEQIYKEKKPKLDIQKEQQSIANIDATGPGRQTSIGSIHPLTQMRWYVEDIFQRMGFKVFEAFDIDDDYHNFQSLNIPPGHPARDIWDTFWTEDGFIPITHTSSMQNRILKSEEVPVRSVILGKVFRNESTDARHEHTLYQCEGIYVDRGITLTDMIGTLKTFFTEFYHKEVDVMISPDYFPFVEPGNGMALSCVICDQKGCNVCKGSGWLEVLGCGMIHPEVLKMGEIDPEVYSGFAWGFGLDRLVMLKYAIEDIRHFHSGDLRFVNQF